MNVHAGTISRPSVCPHDCPSACSLEVELPGNNRIGRVRGLAAQTYTDGVICAKVARYAERIHHPERLTEPLLRVGPKGSGQFRPIGWDEALDRAAEAFLAAEAESGSEAVWPYYYAGTMGLVMRDGIHRLRHAKRYSGMFDTICTNPAWTGYVAGTGRLAGVDPREMAKSDCVVIWGTNAVHTQVNVMHHAIKARKARGAPIIAVDVYMNDTMKQADMPLLVRPGTDAALACAILHVLLREDLADRAYLAKYTDFSPEIEAHLASRTPDWAEAICGVPAGEIEAAARLLGARPRAFFRLGYGFARQRNGAVAMHAALCIPTLLGAWQHEGGGAFHSNSGTYGISKRMIEGLDLFDPAVRMLDQSRIGAVLTGDPAALKHGPPVKAMLIQNTNPANVAPDQAKVRAGFLREDLFTVVHEHFMTDTALLADLVLPATMFLEHDDLYQGGGHTHLMLGPKLVEPPGQCRSNHEVICDLARRLGAEHPGFAMSPRAHIDWALTQSGRGSLAEIEREGFLDTDPPFARAHFLEGFGHRDGRFRFAPDWTRVPLKSDGLMGPWQDMPRLPDHWAAIEAATPDLPFRLVTAPARSFLNSTFSETPGSRKREGAPRLLIHPEDAAALGLAPGEMVRVSNARGAVEIAVEPFAGLRRGVVVAEGIHPNGAHRRGEGINMLTGADPVAPRGGAAFHDNAVAIRRLADQLSG
ncbi:MAG: molybdopterin oxidoreductase family protein [Hyphomicrobiales bacterium]|nr:molybdopterin oxidoreductase family protein [Hyphomicrobiales bacterium]MCA1999240.1 molybdopterin oxidoreductase family protein [Hyphomicrobiales bacterium]